MVCVIPSVLFANGSTGPTTPPSDYQKAALSKQEADPLTYQSSVSWAQGGPTDNLPEMGNYSATAENIELSKWEECQDPTPGPKNEKIGSILDQVLSEAQNGSWHETKNPSSPNPNIITALNDVGIQSDREIAWCAAFAGSVLKRSCAGYLKTAYAGNYANYDGGEELPVNPSAWQKGDLVLFAPLAGNSSGHVAFFYGYDGGGNPLFVGGNQGNTVKPSRLPVGKVRKAWRPA